MSKKLYFNLMFIALCFAVNTIIAQTTAFNYQGKLNDGGNPANGNYQMQFKLFDALAGGTEIGSAISDVPVSAAQGIFSVKLDFGSDALNGANRWLEIAVRHNSSESYTTLSPREQIASSPYSVRTLSAAQADLALDSNKLGGLNASEYVTTTSVGNTFIKNDTAQQTGSFNISGNGFFGGRVGIGTTTPETNMIFQVESFTPGWGIFSRNTYNLFTQGGGGIFGQTTSADGIGVLGRYDGPTSSSGWGVFGFSPNGFAGVFGSGNRNGVFGQTTSTNDSGVFGKNDGDGIGVSGIGIIGDGVFGTSNKNGVHGRTGSAVDSGVWGENTGNGYGTAGSSVNGVGVIGDSTNGFAMQARGNTVQNLDKGGWVKAMVYVDPSNPSPNKIIRCYNSQATGAAVSTPPCGFTYENPFLGYAQIGFGFRVDDRYLSVTNRRSTVRPIILEEVLIDANPNKLTILGTYADNGTFTNASFFLIVY